MDDHVFILYIILASYITLDTKLSDGDISDGHTWLCTYGLFTLIQWHGANAHKIIEEALVPLFGKASDFSIAQQIPFQSNYH